LNKGIPRNLLPRLQHRCTPKQHNEMTLFKATVLR
jgi:hypothetical protein